MKPKMYRQGDVMFIQVPEIPKNVLESKGQGRCIAAFGEVTGHAHEIHDQTGVTFYTAPHEDTGVDQEVGNPGPFDAATWLEVQNVIAEVNHQEHDTVTLDPGKYKIVRQREYSPEAIRNVAD